MSSLAMLKIVEKQNAQLREQNRVLARLLAKAQPHVCSALCPSVKRDGDLWTHKDLCAHMEAALTATSQPAQEQCSYCKRPLTDNHSFSYGVPGVPRVYKCDRADCTKPATSQEGQHEAAN